MATFNTVGTSFGLEYVPSSIRLRFGRREIFICRDCRKRYYTLKPVLDCSTGTEAGYVELVFLRKWLIVLSRAR